MSKMSWFLFLSRNSLGVRLLVKNIKMPPLMLEEIVISNFFVVLLPKSFSIDSQEKNQQVNW